MPNMTSEQAHAVYDILVSECGATDDDYEREDFVFHQAENQNRCTEYRFMGALGFGGKFWVNPSRGRSPWYVNTYPETLTDTRARMIAAANDRLAEIAPA